MCKWIKIDINFKPAYFSLFPSPKFLPQPICLDLSLPQSLPHPLSPLKLGLESEGILGVLAHLQDALSQSHGAVVGFVQLVNDEEQVGAQRRHDQETPDEGRQVHHHGHSQQRVRENLRGREERWERNEEKGRGSKRVRDDDRERIKSEMKRRERERRRVIYRLHFKCLMRKMNYF